MLDRRMSMDREKVAAIAFLTRVRETQIVAFEAWISSLRDQALVSDHLEHKLGQLRADLVELKRLAGTA
jgi:hypothetical protein